MTQAQFERLVYGAVSNIPKGAVMTYGQVACAIGFPGSARRVGRALKYAPLELALPCHRVVNSQGRLVPGWEAEQRRRLEEEQVAFRPNGTVDLRENQRQREDSAP